MRDKRGLTRTYLPGDDDKTFALIEAVAEIVGDAFDRFVANAQGEFASFQSFVTGSLPQVGLASLGLVAGFKK